MNLLWGILTIIPGFFLFLGGRKKSEFFLYRILVSRSRVLWGESTHAFHQVAGILVMIFGLLLALGVFEKI